MLLNASGGRILKMLRCPSACLYSGSIPTIQKQSAHTLKMAADDSLNSKSKPWLLVGLGNPGRMFNGTRHNVGFEMIDTIAQAEGISVSRIQYKALFGKGHIDNVPVMLAKPQTFMNASGESVGQLAGYYKIPINQVLLIFDCMDLPFAKLRLLPKGGHGGHNGRMKSVIDHFKGNREFPRLRIGIGRPPGKMDPAHYVLRPFTKQEREEMDFTLQEGLEAIRILVTEGVNKSATKVNSAQKARIQSS
ncbi:peptidyl-tRNA hydrolase, mitochondrial isoform X1 [Cryptomeria japonica]|uniref:peptidyl-tRNA hydrolase, mitochondrial isoform X1 n=1 Tax=Cryptomeria japonica TaxID=3369 RepID=UPI0027DA00B1|nr:peptidyl-tRNA hydrolase, mitochondrial isoform X1 [Cryptomeria japonica]XP_057835039.2 peptidyl-tRNA hydrolase, mitochondrial isoform X1 [Cryptomeria japonica]